MKRSFILLLATGLMLCAVCLLVSHHQNARMAAEQAATQKQRMEREAKMNLAENQAQSPTLPITAPEPTPPPQAAVIVPMETLTTASITPKVKAAKNAGNQPQPKGQKEWVDPEARLALFFVGTDPVCEEYWVMAINDPTLPPNERKDLIEDLNEEGFPDPKNLTRDDLPLILSRIELIENHGPYAMDEVNIEAFMEAYKDLLTMAARASR
jgi:hypothetical protein